MEGKRVTRFELTLTYDEFDLIIDSLSMRSNSKATVLAEELEALLESDSE